MLVFWKARLALLAVPKTGTQSYEEMLAPSADIAIRHPQGMKHMSARKFYKKFIPLLDPSGAQGIETVAVIRDPLEWLGSWYRYRQRDGISGSANSTKGIEFDAFVEAYLSPTRPRFAAVGQQSKFVGGPPALVTHMFAYENQAGFRAFLSDRLGREIAPPPPVNVSPRAKLSLDSGLEARLRAELAEDFRLHESLQTA